MVKAEIRKISLQKIPEELHTISKLYLKNSVVCVNRELQFLTLCGIKETVIK